MPIAGEPDGAHPAAEGAGRRWAEMLDSLTGLLTGVGCVLIDGPASESNLFATRLGEALMAHHRTVSLVVDPAGAWDVAIRLWTGPVNGPVNGSAGGGGPPYDERAAIVVDLHDTDWLVIRRVTGPLAASGS